MIGFMHMRRAMFTLAKPIRFHILQGFGMLLKAKGSKSENEVDAIEGGSLQLWIQIRVPESNMTMLCPTMNLFIFG